MGRSALQLGGFVLGGFLTMGVGAAIAGSFSQLGLATGMTLFGAGGTVASTLLGWFFPPEIEDPKDTQNPRKYQDLQYTSFQQNDTLNVAHGEVFFSTLALWYGNNKVTRKKTGENAYVIEQGKEKKTVSQDIKDNFYSLDALLALGEAEWEDIDLLYFNDQDVTHLRDDEGTGWTFFRGKDNEQIWEPIRKSGIKYPIPYRKTSKLAWYGEIGTANSVPNITGVAKAQRSTYDTGIQSHSKNFDIDDTFMYYDPDSEEFTCPLSDHTMVVHFDRKDGAISSTAPPSDFSGVLFGVTWAWKNKVVLVENTISGRRLAIGKKGWTPTDDWVIISSFEDRGISDAFDGDIYQFAFDIHHGDLITVHPAFICINNIDSQDFYNYASTGEYDNTNFVGIYYDHETDHLYWAYQSNSNPDEIITTKFIFNNDKSILEQFDTFTNTGFINKTPRGLLKSGDLFLTVDINPNKDTSQSVDRTEYEIDFTEYKDDSGYLVDDTENNIKWAVYREWTDEQGYHWLGTDDNDANDSESFQVKLDDDYIFYDRVATAYDKSVDKNIIAINKGKITRTNDQRITLTISLDAGDGLTTGPIVGAIARFHEDDQGNRKYYKATVQRIGNSSKKWFKYRVDYVVNDTVYNIQEVDDYSKSYKARQQLIFNVFEESGQTRLRLYYMDTNPDYHQPVIDELHAENFIGEYTGFIATPASYIEDEQIHYLTAKIMSYKTESTNVYEESEFNINRFSLDGYTPNPQSCLIWKADINEDPRRIEEQTVTGDYWQQDKYSDKPWHNKATYTYTTLKNPTAVIADPWTGYFFIRDQIDSEWAIFQTRWNKEDWSYVSKSEYRLRIFTSLHSCPGWIFDLITNERYGAGIPLDDDKGIVKIDLKSFEQSEGYCLEQVRVGDDSDYYYENRYNLDGIISNRSNAFEQIQSLASNFNAFVIEPDGIITLIQIRPCRRISKTFTADNIKWLEDDKTPALGWQIVSPINQPNEWITEYRNKDDRFRWYPIRIYNELEQEQKGSNISPWRSISNKAREFVNRTTQNIRMDKQEKRAAILMRETVNFTTGIEASVLTVGDFIEITHDDPGYNKKVAQIANIEELVDENGGIEYQITAKLYDNNTFQNDVIVPNIDIQEQDFGIKTGTNVEDSDPTPLGFFKVLQLEDERKISILGTANPAKSNVFSFDVKYKRGLIENNKIDNYNKSVTNANFALTNHGFVKVAKFIEYSSGYYKNYSNFVITIMNLTNHFSNSENKCLFHSYYYNENDEIKESYFVIKFNDITYEVGTNRDYLKGAILNLVAIATKEHLTISDARYSGGVKIPVYTYDSINPIFKNEEPKFKNFDLLNNQVSNSAYYFNTGNSFYMSKQNDIYTHKDDLPIEGDNKLWFRATDLEWELVVVSDKLFNGLKINGVTDYRPAHTPIENILFWNGSEWKECWGVIDSTDGLEKPYDGYSTKPPYEEFITYSLPWWKIQPSLRDKITNPDNYDDLPIAYFRLNEKQEQDYAISELNDVYGIYNLVLKEMNSLIETDSEDNSIYFQGDTYKRYIELDESALPTNNITVGFWFKSGELKQNVNIFFDILNKSNNSYFYLGYLSDGKISFSYSDGVNNERTINIAPTNSILDGKPHFITLSFDNATKELKIYVDKTDEIFNGTVDTFVEIPSDATFFIGGVDADNLYCCGGFLDEFVIYDKVIDINYLYDYGMGTTNKSSGPWRKMTRNEFVNNVGTVNSTVESNWGENEERYVLRIKVRRPATASELEGNKNIPAHNNIETHLLPMVIDLPDSLNKAEIPELTEGEYDLSFISHTYGPANQPFEDISRMRKDTITLESSITQVDAATTSNIKSSIKIPAFRAVGNNTENRLVLAKANEDDFIPAFGVTLKPIYEDEVIAYKVAVNGATVTNKNWNWTIPEHSTGVAPIYLDVAQGYSQDGGYLTQYPPENGITQQIGFVISPTTILINIVLGDQHAHIYNETPQGEIDGVNQIFTTRFPFKPGSLRIYFESNYSGGVRITPNIDNFGVVEIPDSNGIYNTFKLERAPKVIDDYGNPVNETLKVDYIIEFKDRING